MNRQSAEAFLVFAVAIALALVMTAVLLLGAWEQLVGQITSGLR